MGQRLPCEGNDNLWNVKEQFLPHVSMLREQQSTVSRHHFGMDQASAKQFCQNTFPINNLQSCLKPLFLTFYPADLNITYWSQILQLEVFQRPLTSGDHEIREWDCPTELRLLFTFYISNKSLLDFFFCNETKLHYTFTYHDLGFELHGRTTNKPGSHGMFNNLFDVFLFNVNISSPVI